MENSLELIGTGKDFPNRILTAEALRTTDKWDLRKQKSFCMAKDTAIWKKWQPRKEKKIFTNCTSNRELISKINKELKNLTIRKTNNAIKCVLHLNRKFSTDETKMFEKQLKLFYILSHERNANQNSFVIFVSHQ